MVSYFYWRWKYPLVWLVARYVAKGWCAIVCDRTEVGNIV